MSIGDRQARTGRAVFSRNTIGHCGDAMSDKEQRHV
jgi:hypothetical protein